MAKKWYENNYRRHLCDMHIADWDESFLSKFSAENYYENLKRAKVSCAMIYYQSHAGLCHYPTKVGKMHNAFIGKEDEMKKLTDDPKSIEVENQAIKEYFPHMKELGLRGGLIRVDGEIIAFTFGSPINDKVFDIHSEKALPEYRTAYSVINREFIANELPDFEYVNREDDMGLEGLRTSKLQYFHL